jgi:hypothetical protein
MIFRNVRCARLCFLLVPVSCFRMLSWIDLRRDTLLFVLLLLWNMWRFSKATKGFRSQRSLGRLKA